MVIEEINCNYSNYSQNKNYYHYKTEIKYSFLSHSDMLAQKYTTKLSIS